MTPDTLNRYADILRTERPMDARTFRRHPRMNVADRAKIFAPFAALRGHEDRLLAEDDRLLLRRRIIFDAEEVQRLSEKLSALKKGMEVEVSYFLPDEDPSWGRYVTLRSQVGRVDACEQSLTLSHTTIPFDDLADIRLMETK